MRHDPHKLVEGCLVAGRAMGARAANGTLKAANAVVVQTTGLGSAMPQSVSTEVSPERNHPPESARAKEKAKAN